MPFFVSKSLFDNIFDDLKNIMHDFPTQFYKKVAQGSVKLFLNLSELSRFELEYIGRNSTWLCICMTDDGIGYVLTILYAVLLCSNIAMH